MGLKEAILKKGWAGQTISREETIERLNPLIKQQMALNHTYNHVIDHLSEPTITEHLAGSQKTARVDVSKLAETVFSCGGVAYNGVDMEPEDFDLGDDEDEMLFQLLDQEQAFHHALNDEETVEHHIRTRAVLAILQTNSLQRLNYLKDHTKKRRRTSLSA